MERSDRDMRSTSSGASVQSDDIRRVVDCSIIVVFGIFFCPVFFTNVAPRLLSPVISLFILARYRIFETSEQVSNSSPPEPHRLGRYTTTIEGANALVDYAKSRYEQEERATDRFHSRNVRLLTALIGISASLMILVDTAVKNLGRNSYALDTLIFICPLILVLLIRAAVFLWLSSRSRRYQQMPNHDEIASGWIGAYNHAYSHAASQDADSSVVANEQLINFRTLHAEVLLRVASNNNQTNVDRQKCLDIVKSTSYACVIPIALGNAIALYLRN